MGGKEDNIMTDVIQRTTCASCGGRLETVFGMPEMPLANGLLTASEINKPCKRYPLVSAECQSCGLVQLQFVVDPTILYHSYRFFTGSSTPNTAHFGQLADWIKARTAGRRVLEIASNDGTLLTALEAIGFDVVGVDPAIDQCAMAATKLKRGRVMCKYWGDAAAREEHGRFDVVVACNVLAHVPDLSDFLGAVRRVIRTGGLFVVDVQYLKALIKAAAFDAWYHEHISSFDETSLSAVLTRAGFKVLGWEVIDAHHGTLRMWASPTGTGINIEPSTHDWPAFRAGVELRREYLGHVIHELKSEGRRVCFLGAPAKATILANYCNLTSEDIAFATDTTPAKQGLFIPGANIPIVDPSHMQPPDAAIVTAWNHWPHIAAKEAAFVAAGGMLIKPTLDGLATAIASLERTSHARVGT